MITFTRAEPGTAEAMSSATPTAAEGHDLGVIVLDLRAFMPDIVTSLTRSWALGKSPEEAAADALLITISAQAADHLMGVLAGSLAYDEERQGNSETGPVVSALRKKLHDEAVSITGACGFTDCPLCDEGTVTTP